MCLSCEQEYGVGLNLIKTAVEADPESTTKRFVIAVTDDCQHGMGDPASHSKHVDSFKNGVSELSVFGVDHVNAHKYACSYSPDTVLGFKAWKPHSVFFSLNALLDMNVTVVWCAVGSSANPHMARVFDGWIGTLSTIFEAKRGVLISWSEDELQKPVPATVVHLLNTLMTSGDVDAELSVEKQLEKRMLAAKSYSEAHDGVNKNIGTTVDDAANLLDQLVVESRLPEDEQKTFCDKSFEMLSGSDSVKLDVDVGAIYRSLSAKCAPPAPIAVPGDITETVSRLCKRVAEAAPPCGECDDEEDKPRFRSIGMAMYDGEDKDVTVCYRSLAASTSMSEPVYRSLNGASEPPMFVTQERAKPKHSKSRLLRLSA